VNAYVFITTLLKIKVLYWYLLFHKVTLFNAQKVLKWKKLGEKMALLD